MAFWRRRLAFLGAVSDITLILIRLSGGVIQTDVEAKTLRHCERSEAILLFIDWRGAIKRLLHCVRNDEFPRIVKNATFSHQFESHPLSGEPNMQDNLTVQFSDFLMGAVNERFIDQRN